MANNSPLPPKVQARISLLEQLANDPSRADLPKIDRKVAKSTGCEESSLPALRAQLRIRADKYLNAFPISVELPEFYALTCSAIKLDARSKHAEIAKYAKSHSLPIDLVRDTLEQYIESIQKEPIQTNGVKIKASVRLDSIYDSITGGLKPLLKTPTRNQTAIQTIAKIYTSLSDVTMRQLGIKSPITPLCRGLRPEKTYFAQEIGLTLGLNAAQLEKALPILVKKDILLEQPQAGNFKKYSINPLILLNAYHELRNGAKNKDKINELHEALKNLYR